MVLGSSDRTANRKKCRSSGSGRLTMRSLMEGKDDWDHTRGYTSSRMASGLAPISNDQLSRASDTSGVCMAEARLKVEWPRAWNAAGSMPRYPVLGPRMSTSGPPCSANCLYSGIRRYVSCSLVLQANHSVHLGLLEYHHVHLMPLKLRKGFDR